MDDKAKVGGVRFRMSVADAVVEVRALHQGVRRMCEDYLVEPGFGEDEVAVPADLVVSVTLHR